MRVWHLIILGCLAVLHPYSAGAQDNNMQTRLNELLRRIVSIESTTDDVRRLLGEPIRKSPDFHEFDDFNVMVVYSSGLPCDHPCVERGRHGWKAPRDRVITFVMIIKAPFHQKDLKNVGIDLCKYEKDEDPTGHVPETIYTDNEKGIRVYINGEQVTRIALFPAKKNLPMMCPRTGEKPLCP